MSATRSLTLERNSLHAHEIRLQIYDEEANLWSPINIAGTEYKATIHPTQTDDTILLEWNVEILSGSGGRVVCTLPSASVNLLEVGTYFHVFRDLTNDLKILSGQVTVKG